jgi:hypothetical protein
MTDRFSPGDRTYRATRIVAALVIPFLFAAAFLLLAYPDQTDHRFAWTIKPGLTALFIGAGYLAGAAFLIRPALAAPWHTVAHGFFPISVFAWLLTLATVLHFDRFHHQNVIFYIWAGVYLAACAAIPWVWLRNRREYGEISRDPADRIPVNLRRTAGILGGAMIIGCALFYINPAWMIAIWPWALTPLTARVLIGFLAIAALTELAIAYDGRWSAVRFLVQGQLVGLGLLLVAGLRGWGDFRNFASGILFLGVMFALFGATGGMYIWMERNTG